jgi:hypothetical protein
VEQLSETEKTAEKALHETTQERDAQKDSTRNIQAILVALSAEVPVSQVTFQELFPRCLCDHWYQGVQTGLVKNAEGSFHSYLGQFQQGLCVSSVSYFHQSRFV